MYLYEQVYALFATDMANFIVNDTLHGKIKVYTEELPSNQGVTIYWHSYTCCKYGVLTVPKNYSTTCTLL